MSLKSIEMQIALPRTFDASKIQEQLSQRGQGMNDFAAKEMKQDELKQRTTVMKQEQKDAAKLNHDGEHSNNQRDQKGKQPKSKKSNPQWAAEKHPFKGNLIDFSG
ncbi:MAG TPA: hypothetical protein VJ546_08695 [Bacillales bacterium]|nr:hypothetical protein [Bacillales bacterium]